MTRPFQMGLSPAIDSVDWKYKLTKPSTLTEKCESVCLFFIADGTCFRT